MQVEGKIVRVGAQKRQRASQRLSGVERQETGNGGMGSQEILVLSLGQYVNLGIWTGTVQEM